MDISKARPVGEIKWASARGQGPARAGVDPHYLKKTRENDPWPTDDQSDELKVSLSGCRFATPAAELALNEPFEMEVDVRRLGEPGVLRVQFRLLCTCVRGGKSQTEAVGGSIEGFLDSKAETQAIRARSTLLGPGDYVLGETLTFRLEASHAEAGETAKSDPIDAVVQVVANTAEFGGIHFRTDGEMPLLDEKGALPATLASALDWAGKHPNETLIAFGHADARGDGDSNRRLSLLRGEAIKSLLDHDVEAWAKLAASHGAVQDYQQILQSLARLRGWPCDPGAVDGIDGPNTRTAVRSFQRECNARYRLGLDPDGEVGPKTWRAIHRVLCALVQELLGTDASKAPDWKKPKWGFAAGKGVYPCGEDFPKEKSVQDSQTNRRVELHFYGKGSEPPLTMPAMGAPATTKENPSADPKVVRKKPIPETKTTPSTPAGPPPPDPFADFVTLEEAAIADGYDLVRRVTAFRKIWYGRTGGAWDHVIPGAATTAFPPSWAREKHLASAVERLRGGAVMKLDSADVDIGHLFTGADARLHSARLVIKLVIKLRSNQEQATFVGDLGSVVAEYIHQFKGSFYDCARVKDPAHLKRIFDKFCAPSDMAGNVDSYHIDFTKAATVVDGLRAHYLGATPPCRGRFPRFAPQVRATSKSAWMEEVFNSSLGYAGGKGWVADVASIVLDPGPGLHLVLPIFGDIGSPTIWEAYWNVTGWVVDHFISVYG